MIPPESENPAGRTAGQDQEKTTKHISLVACNPSPRQRLRVRVPMRRVVVSAELLAFLSAMGGDTCQR